MGQPQSNKNNIHSLFAIMKRPIIYCIFFLYLIFSCQQEPPENNDRDALLVSNEIQRTAHLINDAKLLANEIADSMVSVQNGEVSFHSNAEIKERFTEYFKQVNYTSWDDTRPPIIHISEDGTMASVIVNKLIDAQSKEEDGTWGEHGYVLFAWTALYTKVNGQWKMYNNTSSRKDLTKEEAQQLEVHLSTDYATIQEPDLIPEGIAHDQNTGITYVSSTYKQKIVGVKPDGVVFDFKTEQEDGLWSTVGMEVDAERNELWVISSNAHTVLPMKYPDSVTLWSSRLFRYSLSTGKLIEKYDPEINGDYCFNDLCVTNSGTVYITESVQNRVYYLNPNKKSFEPLAIPDSTIIFPNGITHSDDDQLLYIAHRNGILCYSIANNTHMNLQADELQLGRMDGLAYYKNTLVCNQPGLKRILQLALNDKSDMVLNQRILEANHPEFDQPTTGEIAGDTFIYLGNAQMQSGFVNGAIRPFDSLKAVKLFKVRLE